MGDSPTNTVHLGGFCVNFIAMARKLPLLTYFLFFTALNTHSQEPSYTVPNSKFLRLIRDSRFDGCEFVTSPVLNIKKILDLHGIGVGKNGECPLIIQGEIYIHIPATGIVYKCTGSKEADSVRFVRIDSTKLYGYNINSFTFVHNNSLYNLGGYGFWHWNGQLRKFYPELGEWDIVPLNRELPVSNIFPGTYIWKSPINNLLFTFSYIDGNEAVRVERPNQILRQDSVIKLDLISNNWTVMGKLNSILLPVFRNYSLIASMDSGIMVDNHGKLSYLNLLNNTISVSTKRELFRRSPAKINNILTWTKGSKLFYENIQTGNVDSILISSFKFTKINERIYENDSNYLNKLGYVGGILILASIVWGVRKKIVKRQLAAREDETSNSELLSPYSNKEVFTEVEKALLKLLLDNTITKGSSTSIDEINWILGVSNKSVDMQKRKRSDVIRAINEKYQLLHPGVKANLIDRSKSELDARLYEYTLNSDIHFLQNHGINL
jgi:hypothetical protein